MPGIPRQVLTACFTISILLTLCQAIAAGSESLLENGDFENGSTGWNALWSRGGEISGGVQQDKAHTGRSAMAVDHRGTQDWSLNRSQPIAVRPGDVYLLEAEVMLEGQGRLALGAALYESEGNARHWSYGEESTGDTAGHWVTLSTRFVIPPGAARIVPRFIGHGVARGTIDNVRLQRVDHIEALDPAAESEPYVLENARLRLELDRGTGCFHVTDRRTDHTWRQTANRDTFILGATHEGDRLSVTLLDSTGTLPVRANIHLDADLPEVVVELSGDGRMVSNLQYPNAVRSAEGDWLILPVNQGIGYPVDDVTLPEMSYHLHGGHGLCMAWYGLMGVDGRSVLTIVETPDDAEVRIPRIEGRLALHPVWKPRYRGFGDVRRLRYVFFEAGGYVAMCKDYRRRMIERGHLKTLAEKRESNPDVDLLIGAVNIWNWDTSPVMMCRELQAAGIDRILWSRAASGDDIRAMNAMPGVLTSRYDIYSDCMDPAMFPKLRGIHADWTSEAFPDRVVRMTNGDWAKGWEVRTRDGDMYPCALLCDHFNVEFASRRIPAELAEKPYRCRFIDTATASEWRECHDPAHPMTRTDSKRMRMDLLEYVSETCGLVTGCETGHEAAVPYVHYFEGMMSLGPYRVPDAGRNMIQLVEDAPERVAKFQTGPYYRLPLWGLVYHDCVVAQWYWGDYNNKLPSLWDRRDLFNALYGTPPMFMFTYKYWTENKERFVRSYQATAPIARATGYREMLSHEWLSDDHTLQRARFAGGITVTANFGDAPLTTPEGETIGPMSARVTGID